MSAPVVHPEAPATAIECWTIKRYPGGGCSVHPHPLPENFDTKGVETEVVVPARRYLAVVKALEEANSWAQSGWEVVSQQRVKNGEEPYGPYRWIEPE